VGRTDREDHTQPIHESDQQIQQILAGTQPADLPTAQERALVALAGQILTADVTGVGRGRWPAYFGAVAPIETYGDVRVHAGIARRHDGSDAVVDTTLIWSGTSPHGQHVSWQYAVIRLAWDGRSWQPLAIA